MKTEKFTLIKRYPFSPPLGTVVVSGEYPFEKIFRGEYDDRIRMKYKELIEFPEFWKPEEECSVDKQQQKQHIIDIMKEDEKDGLYDEENIVVGKSFYDMAKEGGVLREDTKIFEKYWKEALERLSKQK